MTTSRARQATRETPRPGLFKRLRTAVRAFRSGFSVGPKLAASNGGRLFRDWELWPVSADQEFNHDLRAVRARSRELARNDGYFRHFLRALTINVVGADGPALQAQVRNNSGELARALNDRIELAWREWAKRPTVDRKGTLSQVMRLVLRAVAMDGEIFVRLVTGYAGNRFGFALQLIDADRVDHSYNRAAGQGVNEIRCGVEVDAWGAPVAYHVWTSHPSDSSLRTATIAARERVPAAEMLHLYDPERVAQTRGVPWGISVMTAAHMLRGYEDAELVAARTGAAKMGWFQFRDGAEVEPFDPSKGSVNLDADPGSIGFVPPGMEFQDWSPDHPAAAFGSFVKQCLRRIASGLGLSYNALANDLEGVNFSSMRSGLQLERDAWRVWQSWFGAEFCQPVYERWLFAALATDALVLDSRAPSRFYSVRWHFRGWPWIDPKVEAETAVIRIQNGLASRTMILAEQGLDYEQVLEELEREQALAEQYGVEVSGTLPGARPGEGGSGEPADDDDDESNQDDADDDDEESGRAHARRPTLRIAHARHTR